MQGNLKALLRRARLLFERAEQVRCDCGLDRLLCAPPDMALAHRSVVRVVAVADRLIAGDLDRVAIGDWTPAVAGRWGLWQQGVDLVLEADPELTAVVLDADGPDICASVRGALSEREL